MSDEAKVFFAICIFIVVGTLIGLMINFFQYLKENVFIVWYILGIVTGLAISGLSYSGFRIYRHFRKPPILAYTYDKPDSKTKQF